MMTDQRADQVADLHGHPSAIETIAADFPDWDIHRDRDGGVHGDWKATREGVGLSAPTTTGLLVRLEAQELARLQEAYRATYRVWRTDRYWMGTAVVDGVTPTLTEETSAALEARLRNPGAPIAAQYKLGDL
jgi:hypothetical protein